MEGERGLARGPPLEALVPDPAPHPRDDAPAWRGATSGVAAMVLAWTVILGIGLFGPDGVAVTVLGTLALLLVSALLGGLVTLLALLLGRLPIALRWPLAAALLPLAILALYGLSALLGAAAVFGVSLAAAGLLGASLRSWRAGSGRPRFAIAGALLSGSILLVGGAWLLVPGRGAAAPWGAVIGAAAERVDLPDPSLPGPYAVRTLVYGSGTDARRSEYGPGADLRTEDVDASAMLEGWSPLRRWYWGFGPEALPLNARVWHPDGEGPFPLVLFVHGNADMALPSERGYAYLGQLLASRGFVFVSVDQSFLNLSWLADLGMLARLGPENHVRAWLLLEHLRLWREWNADPDGPLHGLVDEDAIAVGGHSRGGEAAALAAAFDRLRYLPDDASQPLASGFGIRAVLAFAPSDGQYLPGGRPLRLEDVDYLVLHGASDMDVITFMGAGQYHRIDYGGDEFRFKSSVYIENANHGQFNSVWGERDVRVPALWLYARGRLLPGEAQRRIASVYASAFLDASLRREAGYLALLRDHRAGAAWLPPTGYLVRYDDSTALRLAGFDEDLDLTSGSIAGSRSGGSDLTEWREARVEGRWGHRHTQALVLGWDRRLAPAPHYGLDFGTPLELDTSAVLALALAADRPTDDAPAAAAAAPGDGRAAPGGHATSQPIDLTVVLSDEAGRLARVPLTRWGALHPQRASGVARSAWMNVLFEEREPVFETASLPLAWFLEAEPELSLDAITGLRLEFDRT
jgi:hypothetical protein